MIQILRKIIRHYTIGIIDNFNNKQNTITKNDVIRTYDDNFSRQVTIDFFKKYFNINLIPHPGLVYKDTNILAKNGQYCIDLVSDDYQIEVEVERNSEKSPLFDKTLPYTDFSLIVSKFEQYFRANDGKTRFMAYVLDNGSKISIMHGDSIRKLYLNGVECKWYETKHTTNKHMIHAYMMNMDISATFDTNTGKALYIGKNYIDFNKQHHNLNHILEESTIYYTPDLFSK